MGQDEKKKRGCEVFGFEGNLFITFIPPRAKESLRKKSGVWKEPEVQAAA